MKVFLEGCDKCEGEKWIEKGFMGLLGSLRFMFLDEASGLFVEVGDGSEYEKESDPGHE